MDTMREPGTSSDKGLVLVRVPPEQVRIARNWMQSLMQGVRFNNPILFSIEQAVALCEQGRMQLWIARDMAEEKPCLFFLTEVVAYPAGTTVRVCLIRGRKFRKVMDQFWGEFQDWCKAQGAHFIEAEAQPTLGRIMKSYGYVPTAVKFYKPLVTVQ